MTVEYAEADWVVVDYQGFCLDPNVRDRQTNQPLWVRGPRPHSLAAGEYFVCLGAAQTFGRFCERPYPTLLQDKLGMPVLNLGRGGAGPSFFSAENKPLLEYINGARFAVVQVMAGRSAGNSLYESKGLGHYTRVADGTPVGCDEAFRELLRDHPESYARLIVAETRWDWVQEYRRLFEAITVPKVLLWFSERTPAYSESYGDVYSLFGKFPQLVNGPMVEDIRRYCDAYVECVSQAGLPQPLFDRFTGTQTILGDKWGGHWERNWYYPSPEMHVAAADALHEACSHYQWEGAPA